MKIVYTPKRGRNVINVATNRDSYNCEAYDYFRQKRKDDLLEIVSEINRRQEDKYHLPQL